MMGWSIFGSVHQYLIAWLAHSKSSVIPFAVEQEACLEGMTDHLMIDDATRLLPSDLMLQITQINKLFS